MKPIIITLFISLFLFTSGYSQIQFEGKVNSKYKSIKLEDGTFKYVKYNSKKQTVYIYNLDNSLWRTVKLPLPKNHLLDQVQMITQKTFNNDEDVEIVYSCVEYTQPDNFEDPLAGFADIKFTLNVITEAGKSLLKVNDSNEMELINVKGKRKMLVYKHVGKGFSEGDETLIYNLP